VNSTDALPIGGPSVKCSLCGLVARSPIVIAETKKDGELADYGLCKNRKACHVRTIRRERLDTRNREAAGER
jgi:hypothetical protein